jgi:light-regulated signal transduction histidine kinase (bacteriophytochrome)
MTQTVPVDFSNCAQEPIHIPGTIQPHGAMFVCESDEATIAFASANTGEFVGQPPEALLGQSLAVVLGDEGMHDLRNAMSKGGAPPAPGVLLGIRTTHGDRRLDLIAHRHHGRLIVELEPAAADPNQGAVALDTIQVLLRRMSLEMDVDAIALTAARLARATLGYDRVMVYRFLHNAAGRVIAEAKRGDMHSFLDQHFPAGDIPEQARRLYLENWLRLIADASYTPVPLHASPLAHTAPVDMSHAHLRSVSPIHCEYLRNMGVVASLSISLVVDGRLWGLIACHHESVRTMPLPMRTAAEMFGQYVSMQLTVAERRDQLRTSSDARRRLDELARTFSQERPIAQELRSQLPRLAELIECDGAALWLNGEWLAIGSTPMRDEIGPVLIMLERKEVGVLWETNELRAHHGLVQSHSRVAGVFAIPLSVQPRDFLLLFRDEEAHTVTWAGKPTKTVVAGPHGSRLTPRGSFDAWREEVRGRAPPWSEADRSVAEAIKTYLRDIALKHNELLDTERTRAEHRRRILTDELQHRVKNILALVKSISTQTGVHATSVEDYASALEGRLRALSYAHDQSLTTGRRADLTALLETELSLHQFGSAKQRILMSGPTLGFTEQAFTSIALLVHEMMTNAAKYGSLSTSGGRMTIEWGLAKNGDCYIEWRESNGPRVEPPVRKGFGSTLIDSMVGYDLGGTIEITYPPDGLHARFVIPARHIARVAEPEAVAIASPQAARPLEGAYILLVEDRALIAIDTEAELRKLGARDVAASPSAPAAILTLEARTPDLAILDFNLGEETSEALADLLASRGIPFVFLSGYADTAMIPERFADVRVLRKPIDAASAADVLAAAVHRTP